MAIVSLNELKSYFNTGDFPTEQQFGNFIDTMGNVLEVVNNIGSKLFHDPSVEYPANSAVLTTAGIWYNIDPVGPAAFNTNDWSLLFSFTSAPNVVSLGVPSYEPTKNDYETGDQVNWKNVIYEAIDGGPFGGIEPGVDPAWEDYWVAVVYTEGGVVPVLTSGFVKFDRVYEYTGNNAPKGLYRSVPFEGGYDGGYKLSIGSFATDLTADKWRLVSLKQEIYSFRVELTQSELTNGVTKAIPECPAPGVGYAWVTINAQEFYTFGTEPYDAAQVRIRVTGTTRPQFTDSDATQASDSFNMSMTPYTTADGADVTIIENAGLEAFVQGGSTTGDGTAIIYGQAILLPL